MGPRRCVRGRKRSEPDPDPADAAPDPLASLHAFREGSGPPPISGGSRPRIARAGLIPYVIRALPETTGPARFAGILRGRDVVVLLDASLQELSRAATAASPSGLAISAQGEIFVAGEQATKIHRYLVEDGRLQPHGELETGALALRDVAGGAGGRALCGGGAARAAPVHPARRRRAARDPRGDGRISRRARRLARPRRQLARAHDRRSRRRRPRVSPRRGRDHRPPRRASLGFDAVDAGGELLLAAGGVEDHPLDRTGGSFGYIDSFVFFYRVAAGSRVAERIAAINVSALGVVTPKAILLRAVSGGFEARVAGYGSDRLLTIALGPPGSPGSPRTATISSSRASRRSRRGRGTIFGADPLLDAWIGLAGDASFLVHAEEAGEHPPDPTPASRLGEALFFTTAMAPWTSSEGPLSRFTCETCHF